jgi:hypothetical protein
MADDIIAKMLKDALGDKVHISTYAEQQELLKQAGQQDSATSTGELWQVYRATIDKLLDAGEDPWDLSSAVDQAAYCKRGKDNTF